ncbi:MAG: S1 RNA-binding domain-containing protein [Planctomycetes bacterium]|nr:S1 RNA-binding domain-containing protein [Planctomycetota bacterium]
MNTDPKSRPSSNDPHPVERAAPTPASAPSAVERDGGIGLRARIKSVMAQDTEPGDEVPVEVPGIAPSAGGSGRVPVPSRLQFRSSAMDDALAAALGGRSMDDLLATCEPPTAPPSIDLESRFQASIVRIHKDNVFFSLGGHNEGVASVRQFATPPELGARFEILVTGYNAEDGLYEVSIPGASTTVGDWTDIVEGALVEARVTAANTGGLECMVSQLRGFIPASQVGLYRVDNLADFVDQKLLCVVTEANPRRQNLVLSRRSVLEREKEEARRGLLESLREGETREGVVRNIRDFGAFVDLGGVDGLIHVSQMSWDRVGHPSEVLEMGQKVRVRVEKVDRQTGKIGLSLRTLQEHPWEKAPLQFPVGSVARGVVTRIADFGAFVKLAPGVEGLIHISELAHHRVARVGTVVAEGQDVQVKIVSMDVANQRVGLSLKALASAPESEPESDADMENSSATPSAAPAPPRARQPLRGGLERGPGGDRFGLKW